MNQGIQTILYSVKNIAQSKELYSKLLGVAPFVDQPYYVAFMVGDQQIGLVGNGEGITTFYHVDDIKQSLQGLLDSGAQLQQDVKDVGGGKLNATVKDADGNVIGLIQMP